MITSPVSATPTESGGGEQEIVLADSDETDALEGLLYIMGVSLFGDFFGSKKKTYAPLSAGSADPAELANGVGDPPLVVSSLSSEPSELLHQVSHPDSIPSSETSSAAVSEPTAALLMAMDMTVTSMRLRRRSRSKR